MFFPGISPMGPNGNRNRSSGFPRSQTLDIVNNDHGDLEAANGAANDVTPTIPSRLLRREATIDDDDVSELEVELENTAVNPNTSSSRRSRALTRSSTLFSLLSISSSHGHPISSLWHRFWKLINPPSPVEDAYVPLFRVTPIISGVIIPLSILLEIPGLTMRWYVRTEENKTVESRKNPIILDVGIALSLACALIANIALIIRFLEKRITTMTIICIVFLSIHDTINITAVTIFGVEHRFNDGFTYGEAFWLTVCSTIVSTITNISLITDYIRTPDFKKRGSGLTRKQRSLVIIVIVLFSYIAIGALINSIMMDLSFIDGLYFTVCSIETIGFGDIVPHSTGSRVFVCAYSAIGILNLAVAVGMTRETVLEALEVGYRRRVHNLRVRRRDARSRRKAEARWREVIQARLREKDVPIWVRIPTSRFSKSRFKRSRTLHSITSTASHFTTRIRNVADTLIMHSGGPESKHWHPPFGMRLNIDALSVEELQKCAIEANVSLPEMIPPDLVLLRAGIGESRKVEAEKNTHAKVGRMAGILTRFALAVHGTGTEPDRNERGRTLAKDHDGEKEDSEDHSVGQAFDTMRSSLELEEKRAFLARLLVAWTLFIVFWLVGSGIFMATEQWGYGTAMYFCFIAFSTLGYGDYSPQTPAGRSIFVVWALAGVGAMTILISVLSDAYSSRYKSVVHSSAFENAVRLWRKRERNKQKTLAEQKRRSRSGSRHRNTSPSPFGKTQPIAAFSRAPSIFPHSPRSASPSSISGNQASSSPPSRRQSTPAQTPRRQSSPPPFKRTLTAVQQGQTGPTPVTMAPEQFTNQAVDTEPYHRARRAAQKQLEALPSTLLAQTRSFRDHLQFFIGGGSKMPSHRPIPIGLRDLLDNIASVVKPPDGQQTPESIARVVRFRNKLWQEVLSDSNARQTLLTISMETALHGLIDTAETAMAALAERDQIAEQLREEGADVQSELDFYLPDTEDDSGVEEFAPKAPQEYDFAHAAADMTLSGYRTPGNDNPRHDRHPSISFRSPSTTIRRPA